MLTVYLKPTNFCNVDCEHCYLPKTVRANKDKMDDETLLKVFNFIKGLKNKLRKEKVFLIWHGGEPLVLSPKYFENAGKIIDSVFDSGEVIEAVQTSLIPYKEEFSSIVHSRWRSEIGTSIDFNTRVIKGSPEEYQKLWLSKVDLARKDDILVMPGMVPSKRDCYNTQYIYNWFIDREFYIWNIDRYTSIGQKLPDQPTNREHSKFLIKLFDCVIESIQKKGVAPYIGPVAAGIGGVLYDMPGDRWGGTCQSDFIVINPDGSLNNCPDKDSFEESYGSLHQGIESFISSPLRKKWIRIQQAEHRINECYTCENSSWCKSGCPITNNACSINGVMDECSGYKSYINHVRKFVATSKENKEILEKYFNRELFPKSQNVTKEQLINLSL